MKKSLVVLFVVLAAALLVSGLAFAKVKGQCAECHTMHNSQDGAAVAIVNNVSWSGGELSGDYTSETPNGHLLLTDCIGCHSSADGSTIITTTSGNVIPIVYNPNGLTETDMLAAGNFYYVDLNDANGHNVTPASGADGVLTRAPGLPDSHHGTNCATGCHMTLFNPDMHGEQLTGCQGCHYETFHHKDAGMPTSFTNEQDGKAVDPTYRFLTGHHYLSGAHGTSTATQGTYVEGIEDSEWEYGDYDVLASAGRSGAAGNGHNIYRAYTAAPADIINSTSRDISGLCAACHENFHVEQAEGGTWVRHPVDVTLPGAGEYANYTYMTNYSTEAPVAFVDNVPAAGNGAVMCLSCHRAHGSPNLDMLRWDYSTMTASASGSGTTSDTGCFTCHTSKNNP
jgi:predicted CXXCH cytochrome family protein